MGKRPDREKEFLGFLVEFQLHSVEFSAKTSYVPVGVAVNFLIRVLSSFREDKEENHG